jgi:hypothetical protein
MTVNERKNAVEDELKAQFQHLLRGPEEKHEKHQSGQSVSLPRFKLATSRTRSVAAISHRSV